ncbi:hypothetical protein AB1Y20_021586 [Prymnesium parvum]|uniref:Fatty acid synthase n=1 Tax=Prymnesium parvum TaxID=97485 RepID=A0AB34JLM9_PRYPA
MPRVHINGFACRGPGFNTAAELSAALFEQRDMASCSMEGKECFDHTFFRVPAKQAAATDPQIRALLELTYTALVEAGVSDFSVLPRERTGVYVGSSFGDFQHSALADGSRVQGYEHIGAAGNMLANSVSRFFQFGGPSMKIDTACSSSLTALDIACNDIRSGRCELAVVAGCNLTLNPAVTRVYQQMGIVSQQDRPQCMPFSKDAAGYVRQEAIVVLVVSSLRQLQAEGVMASAEVLANESVCGSGESVCSPSVSTQEGLYRRVAAMAAPLIELHGERVAYVECHATGTLVGDAAETQALVEVLLALEQGELPPDRHYTHAQRNRCCNGLSDGTLKVVTEPTRIARDAIVVVNSFGFGGTHTQVMVRGIAPPHQAKGASDDASCPDEAACSTREPWMCINPVLARSEATAQVVAHSTRQHHFTRTVAPPEVHQDDFRARAFTTAVSRLTHTSTAAVQPIERHPVWLVFAGEGGQWAEMGSELYQRSPAYKAMFDECAAYVLNAWQCDAMQRLLHEAAHGPFRDALDATICLVGVQVCLVGLLRQAGVTSASCAGWIGYSSGEIAAGYFDGCYSLQTTLDIAVLRGRAAVRASSYHEGSMCAVHGLSREQIDDEIRSSMRDVEVACHTAERQISVSGVASEMAAFEAWVRSRHPHASVARLQTYGVAFHSRQLDEALPELQRDLDSLLPAGVEARSDGWVPASGRLDDPTRGSSFHCRGIRECVEFYRACQSIPLHSMVIECGSSAMLHSAFPGERYTYLPLLRRGEDAVETLSAAYGQLFLHDSPLSPLNGQQRSPRVAFPAPAQRSLREAFLVFDHSEKFSQYLYPITNTGAEREYGPAHHAPTVRKSFHFDVEGRARWLRDHRVDERCLFPTAGYLYMMSEMSAGQECVILEFEIHAPVDMLECSSLEFCVELRHNEALHHHADLPSERPNSSELDSGTRRERLAGSESSPAPYATRVFGCLHHLRRS